MIFALLLFAGSVSCSWSYSDYVAGGGTRPLPIYNTNTHDGIYEGPFKEALLSGDPTQLDSAAREMGYPLPPGAAFTNQCNIQRFAYLELRLEWQTEEQYAICTKVEELYFALYYAVVVNDIPMVKKLLELGAETELAVHVCDVGLAEESPLYEVLFDNYFRGSLIEKFEMIKLLLEAGASTEFFNSRYCGSIAHSNWDDWFYINGNLPSRLFSFYHRFLQQIFDFVLDTPNDLDVMKSIQAILDMIEPRASLNGLFPSTSDLVEAGVGGSLHLFAVVPLPFMFLRLLEAGADPNLMSTHLITVPPLYSFATFQTEGWFSEWDDREDVNEESENPYYLAMIEMITALMAHGADPTVNIYDCMWEGSETAWGTANMHCEFDISVLNVLMLELPDNTEFSPDQITPIMKLLTKGHYGFKKIDRNFVKDQSKHVVGDASVWYSSSDTSTLAYNFTNLPTDSSFRLYIKPWQELDEEQCEVLISKDREEPHRPFVDHKMCEGLNYYHSCNIQAAPEGKDLDGVAMFEIHSDSTGTASGEITLEHDLEEQDGWLHHGNTGPTVWLYGNGPAPEDECDKCFDGRGSDERGDLQCKGDGLGWKVESTSLYGGGSCDEVVNRGDCHGAGSWQNREIFCQKSCGTCLSHEEIQADRPLACSAIRSFPVSMMAEAEEAGNQSEVQKLQWEADLGKHGTITITDPGYSLVGNSQYEIHYDLHNLPSAPGVIQVMGGTTCNEHQTVGKIKRESIGYPLVISQGGSDWGMGYKRTIYDPDASGSASGSNMYIDRGVNIDFPQVKNHAIRVAVDVWCEDCAEHPWETFTCAILRDPREFDSCDLCTQGFRFYQGHGFCADSGECEESDRRCITRSNHCGNLAKLDATVCASATDCVSCTLATGAECEWKNGKCSNFFLEGGDQIADPSECPIAKAPNVPNPESRHVCCDVHESPHCGGSPTIFSECVSQFDNFCKSTAWDGQCVEEAKLHCGLVCSACD